MIYLTISTNDPIINPLMGAMIRFSHILVTPPQTAAITHQGRYRNHDK